MAEGRNKMVSYEIYLSTPWPYLPIDLLVDSVFIRQWVERNALTPQVADIEDKPGYHDPDIYYWCSKQKKCQLQTSTKILQCDNKIYFCKAHLVDTKSDTVRLEGHLNICIRSRHDVPDADVCIWFHHDSFLPIKEEISFEGSYFACRPSEECLRNRKDCRGSQY